MPVYNSLISRGDSDGLIPIETSREIMQGVTEQSAVMRLARRMPNMSTKQRKIPVLATLPTAYFVDGDTGLKQTTKVDWTNKNLIAEELAVIVPVPEAVIDDASYDIWGEVKPLIVEAMGVAFDAAVLHGTNAPASWPDDLLTGAAAAGHTVDLSTQIGAGDDLYDIIMGEGGVLALVEEDGYMVNGHAAALSMKAKLRGLRDANGQPIFMRSMQEGTRYELDGEPMYFPRNGAIDPATALMFSGDWTKVVYALRQDITWKLADQASLHDAAGNLVYNLFQQDMIAMRVVMRIAWQIANPINRVNPDDATRYPFAVLVP